jgi:hypothetical protein
MKKATVNVVIHFPVPPAGDRLNEVGRALEAMPGVRRVALSTRLRGVMLVDYDPATVNAQSILAGAARRGLDGRLVGL